MKNVAGLQFAPGTDAQKSNQTHILDDLITSIANVATQLAQFAGREANRVQTYRFKALPQEVDIRRVLNENKTAGFLLIQFSRTVHVNGRNKKERPDAGFILFINKKVLDLFDSSGTDTIIAGETLHSQWGYRWLHQLMLDDDLEFDTDDVNDQCYFRGSHVAPVDTAAIIKEITVAKERMKELKSADAPAGTGKKKYTKEEKKKLVDVTVKVL